MRLPGLLNGGSAGVHRFRILRDVARLRVFDVPEYVLVGGFQVVASLPERALSLSLLGLRSAGRVLHRLQKLFVRGPLPLECISECLGLMGVAEYQLAGALPKGLEANLPSIEQIERELGETSE